MYAAPFRRPGAGEQYRTVDLHSKVAAASPHRLVAILYEELIGALGTARQAVRRGDVARRNEAAGRALALLQSLEASLDHAQGGEVSRALAAVYAEARRLVALGRADGDADALTRAQAMLGEIAAAWNAIG